VRVERERLRSVLDAEAEAEAEAAAKEADGEESEGRMEVDKNIPTMSEEERRLVEEDTSCEPPAIWELLTAKTT
jgi:hypothetical protein